MTITPDNDNDTENSIPEVQQKTKEAMAGSGTSAKKPTKASTTTVNTNDGETNVTSVEKQDSVEIGQQPKRKAQK